MTSVETTKELDYLPARQINEFVYCPRLFYYETVEGIFVHNVETVEGEIQHRRVDAKQDDLPPPNELLENTRHARLRSVTLSSDKSGVIAKMDLIETDGQTVVPVDYKRGRPRVHNDGSLDLWDTDRAQLAVQALVLRENGYTCNEAIVFYGETRQRVRLTIDDALLKQTQEWIVQARRTMQGPIPPPLEDSPKCPRCSLVGICLPDETRRCGTPRRGGKRWVQQMLFDLDTHAVEVANDTSEPTELRRLIAARDDQRPLYLNTQGLYVGKSGQVLTVKEQGKLIQEVRFNEICQLNLFGNIQLTTQAIQALCEAELPIAYFSQGGWFYGITQGLGVKNIFLRREQFRLADVSSFCLRLARALVAGKIRNQRTLLQRNHTEPPRRELALLKCFQDDAQRAESLAELLGIEGNAARLYFQHFSGMIKVGSKSNSAAGYGTDRLAEVGLEADSSSRQSIVGKQASGLEQQPDEQAGSVRFTFDFVNRNRRPPRDAINALLSLAYSLLAKDLTITAQVVGFDPYLGYYHQPRFGRASLALDLMEPFRPLIADSAVLSAVNTRMVTESDFVRAGKAVALTAEGRKKFFRAYEQRMDSLVTHPLFGYRLSYRRLLEVQTRLLARQLTGELTEYQVFTTR